MRLSSADLSKVSFPTLQKTDAQDSNLLRSNDPLGVKISERIFPKETPPVAQWVQDFSSPPPRWDLAVFNITTGYDDADKLWKMMRNVGI